MSTVRQLWSDVRLLQLESRYVSEVTQLRESCQRAEAGLAEAQTSLSQQKMFADQAVSSLKRMHSSLGRLVSDSDAAGTVTLPLYVTSMFCMLMVFDCVAHSVAC